MNNAIMCDNNEVLRSDVQPTELINIGATPPEKAMSVRELFEQLARREAEMVRRGRELAHKHADDAE